MGRRLLGAGYDTRAYGDLKSRSLHFFELDQRKTQQLKIASLRDAGIDSSHVTFIEVDFTQDRLFEKLEVNGFDPSKKTLFLWEGVTLYLTEVEVRKTLQDIKGHAADSSVVVADIYGERMLEFMNRSASKKTLELTNEGLTFGLPFATEYAQTLREFIESEGLKQRETYFMGSNDEKGPFVAIVEIGI